MKLIKHWPHRVEYQNRRGRAFGRLIAACVGMIMAAKLLAANPSLAQTSERARLEAELERGRADIVVTISRLYFAGELEEAYIAAARFEALHDPQIEALQQHIAHKLGPDRINAALQRQNEHKLRAVAAENARAYWEEFERQAGPAPTNGAITRAVKTYLKDVINDPDSLILETCSEPVFVEKKGWSASCRYRAKTIFGGYGRETRTFLIKNGTASEVGLD